MLTLTRFLDRMSALGVVCKPGSQLEAAFIVLTEELNKEFTAVKVGQTMATALMIPAPPQSRQGTAYAWKCFDSECPERKPILSSDKPRCYTCGEAMLPMEIPRSDTSRVGIDLGSRIGIGLEWPVTGGIG